MLEVYDRGIPSRSLPTLVFAVLDIIRSRVMSRIAVDSGVMLSNWYAGSNTIESFQTNNGDTFTIT
ncbi:hypothetical protein DA83_05485 [Pseudomonas sp. 250J]|uniref:hypothetical protein n=1 Tax=unclassified Pseudomonas TaxID=196821 RepID=UPI0006828539|nr:MULTISPECIES: hypothetical protein [unclassified Pseudomonas]KNX76761.1 hypothetical protein DA83_05485 [Pseudomonas sp. 250J]